MSHFVFAYNCLFSTCFTLTFAVFYSFQSQQSVDHGRFETTTVTIQTNKVVMLFKDVY